MKHEWKKHEKVLYGAKQEPSVVIVPKQQLIMISGKGNPNNIDFSERVPTLYSLAYSVKMNYKSASAQFDIQDFTVYPLEGLWELKARDRFIKENLEYRIMIRQPDFITDDTILVAMGKLNRKS